MKNSRSCSSHCRVSGVLNLAVGLWSLRNKCNHTPQERGAFGVRRALAAIVFTQRKAARARRTPNAPRLRATYLFRKGCNRATLVVAFIFHRPSKPGRAVTYSIQSPQRRLSLESDQDSTVAAATRVDVRSFSLSSRGRCGDRENDCHIYFSTTMIIEEREVR